MEPLRQRAASQIMVRLSKRMQGLPPMELSVLEAVFEVGGSMFEGLFWSCRVYFNERAGQVGIDRRGDRVRILMSCEILIS